MKTIPVYISLRQRIILTHLRKNGGKVRRNLVKELSMPRTTIFDNLRKLEKKKLVFKLVIITEEVGRPLVLWEATNTQDLVLVYKSNILIQIEQSNKDIIKKQCKPNAKKYYTKDDTKNKKIPKWVKKELLKEVMHITHILKKLDIVLKPKKPLREKPSFILKNRNKDLVKYMLDEINKCTYFRTIVLSKRYVNVLKLRHIDIQQNIRNSISVRIGKLTNELCDLGLIAKHNEATRPLWRNLYKGNLHTVLNERMEKEYHIIKLKRGK